MKHLVGLRLKMADRDDRQLERILHPGSRGPASPNARRFTVPADPTPKRERLQRAVMPCTLRPRRPGRL